MAKLERVRDFVNDPPSAEYFAARAGEGYRLVSIEWERGTMAEGPPLEDVPFGLRVASDCRSLEESPEEKQVLLLMMEGIAKDSPLSSAVQTINERGFRTRDGQKWTLPALFDLLPRLIDLGPRLCTSEEWVERRKQIFNVA
jgi:hypothetical protein